MDVIFSVLFVSLQDRAVVSETVRAGSKRHTPITFGEDSPKQPRTSSSSQSQREIYTPPSGKYSNKVSSYSKFSTTSHITF
jgi:hypothetical protein